MHTDMWVSNKCWYKNKKHTVVQNSKNYKMTDRLKLTNNRLMKNNSDEIPDKLV